MQDTSTAASVSVGTSAEESPENDKHEKRQGDSAQASDLQQSPWPLSQSASITDRSAATDNLHERTKRIAADSRTTIKDTLEWLGPQEVDYHKIGTAVYNLQNHVDSATSLAQVLNSQTQGSIRPTINQLASMNISLDTAERGSKVKKGYIIKQMERPEGAASAPWPKKLPPESRGDMYKLQD